MGNFVPFTPQLRYVVFPYYTYQQFWISFGESFSKKFVREKSLCKKKCTWIIVVVGQLVVKGERRVNVNGKLIEVHKYSYTTM